MPFKKGNKEGNGRPKGAENKLTKEARELFIETLEGQVPNIEDAFAEVLKKNPAKYTLFSAENLCANFSSAVIQTSSSSQGVLLRFSLETRPL